MARQSVYPVRSNVESADIINISGDDNGTQRTFRTTAGELKTFMELALQDTIALSHAAITDLEASEAGERISTGITAFLGSADWQEAGGGVGAGLPDAAAVRDALEDDLTGTDRLALTAVKPSASHKHVQVTTASTFLADEIFWASLTTTDDDLYNLERADDATVGVSIGDMFQAVITAGGAPLATLAAIIASLSDTGGDPAEPAEDTDYWAGGDTGMLFETPEGSENAEIEQSEAGVTVVAGDIDVDGTLFWNEVLAITESSDFLTVGGLTVHKRVVRAVATGGPWDITATGFDVLEGFGTGGTTAVIASGDTAYFEIWLRGANTVIRHIPGSVAGWLANLDLADTSALAGSFTAATATVAASLDFHEGTDNGTNRVRLIGQASTGDITVTLPSAAGTLLTSAAADEIYQPLADDLFSLATNWTQASASGASSLLFHEDTDNGSNTATLIGPASTANVILTLPAVTGTLISTGNSIGLQWTDASASSAASLKFLEDTDNGTNSVTLIGAASTADVTITLPAATGTVALATGTDTVVWAGSSLTLAPTLAAITASLVYKTITPDGSENCALDGTLGFNFKSSIDDDADLNKITNLLQGYHYIWLVTADATPRAVTASGAGATFNFGAGVTIAASKRGLFDVWFDGTTEFCTYLGQQD